jgi:hypothetical protein
MVKTIFVLILALVTSNVTGKGLKPLHDVLANEETAATGNRKLLQVSSKPLALS